MPFGGKDRSLIQASFAALLFAFATEPLSKRINNSSFFANFARLNSRRSRLTADGRGSKEF